MNYEAIRRAALGIDYLNYIYYFTLCYFCIGSLTRLSQGRILEHMQKDISSSVMDEALGEGRPAEA